MIRNVLAVIAGYATLVVLVVAWSVVALVIMTGQPPSQEALASVKTPEFGSNWFLANVGVTFVLAIAGGFVCAKVAAHGSEMKAGAVLASIMLVVGLLLMTVQMQSEGAAAVPWWWTLSEQGPGIIGVLIGARIGRRPPEKS